MKGLVAPQNTFLDSIANHFDGTRKYFKEYSYIVFLFRFNKLGMVHWVTY